MHHNGLFSKQWLIGLRFVGKIGGRTGENGCIFALVDGF